MLFLFNDVIFEIGQPADAIRSGELPVSAAEFSKLQTSEVTLLACEAVFADLQFPHTQPEKAAHMSVLLAAKTGANSILIGAPPQGAREPAEMGVRMAEVSMFTISHLYQLQLGGTLQSVHVHQAVWQNLTG
ncbi:hypothetical protein MNBD_ALPHA06-1431 [hydrothermal vent metagenome]|uniref:Uncharacterized protein n=1 Tax=hydrothermal vent metagenome TaxID=652676 RepID=A0A3B0RHA5_9ZZZZ